MLECHDFHGNPFKQAMAGHLSLHLKDIFGHKEYGMLYKNQYKWRIKKELANFDLHNRVLTLHKAESKRLGKL